MLTSNLAQSGSTNYAHRKVSLLAGTSGAALCLLIAAVALLCMLCLSIVSFVHSALAYSRPGAFSKAWLNPLSTFHLPDLFSERTPSGNHDVHVSAFCLSERPSRKLGYDPLQFLLWSVSLLPALILASPVGVFPLPCFSFLCEHKPPSGKRDKGKHKGLRGAVHHGTV